MSEHSPGRALGLVGRLVRKEVSTILRDRRTIITLVLMPVLLYPLLTIAFRQFLLASKKEEKQTPEYGICFASTEEANVVMSLLERGGEALLRTPSPVGAGVKAPPQPVVRFVPKGPADPRSAVEAKQADLGLRLRLPQRRE